MPRNGPAGARSGSAKLAEEHRERERSAKAAKQNGRRSARRRSAGRLAGRRCGPSAPTRGGPGSLRARAAWSHGHHRDRSVAWRSRSPPGCYSPSWILPVPSCFGLVAADRPGPLHPHHEPEGLTMTGPAGRRRHDPPRAAARRRRRRRPGGAAGPGRGRHRDVLRRPAGGGARLAGRRRRVGPPGRPRRGLRPRLQPRLLADGRRGARRAGRAVRGHPRRRVPRARRWPPAAAGSTSARRRSRTPSGPRAPSPSTATGSRSASTCAATTLAARGWTREGGDLWEVLARLDRDGCAALRGHRRHQGRHAAGAEPGRCCARSARPPPRPVDRQRRGVHRWHDLRRAGGLVADGVEGAIVGKALYAQAFTLEEALAAVAGAAGSTA